MILFIYLILFLVTFLMALFLEYSTLQKKESDVIEGNMIKILPKIFLVMSIVIGVLITYDVFINLKKQYDYINGEKTIKTVAGIGFISLVFVGGRDDFEHWLKRKFVKKKSFLDKNKSLVENFAIFHNYSSISKKRMQFINLMVLFGQIILYISAFNIMPIIFETMK